MLVDEFSLSNAERFFSGFATGFIGKTAFVKVAADDLLGYTRQQTGNNPVLIVLCRDHVLIKDLQEKFKTVFRFGILVHEILHQVYTDFDECAEYRQKKYGDLFKIIFNIFEDARIEHHADSVFGGDALDALMFVNEICFNASSEITAEINVFQQVKNALIHIKYAGTYKGELSDEAEECLNRISELYAAAVSSCSGAECVHLAYEAAKIIANSLSMDCSCESSENDLFPKEPKGTGKGKSFEKSGAQSNVDSFIADRKGKDESSGTDCSDEKHSENEDRNSKEELENSLHKTTDDSDPYREKSKNIVSKHEKAAEQISKTIEALEGNSDSFNIRNKSEKIFFDGKYTVITENEESGDENRYNSVVSDFSHEINILASKIVKETATESKQKKHTKNGKLNIKRTSNPAYTGTRIFDKKEEKDDHSVAVMIAVDISASMKEDYRYCIARSASVMIAEAFVKAKIPIKIIGFSTQCENSDVDTVYHKEYVSWRNASNRTSRSSLMNMKPVKNNMDGPSIRCCANDLLNRSERNKVLVVISDGCPNAKGYKGSDAIKDTKSAIKEAQKRIDVLGINLLRENENLFADMYGKRGSICLDNVSELPQVLIKELKKMAKKW